MGVHFPEVDLDNVIRFSTLSRMLGCLWQSPKWEDRFVRFPQHMSGLKVLACSFNTEFNYVITLPQLRPSLKHEVKLRQL